MIKNIFSKCFKNWGFILFLLIILEILIIGMFNSTFLNISNLLYSSSDFMHIVIVAIPFTLIVITGGIDISITSVMGFTSIIFGILFSFFNMPIPIAILLALICSSICGVINGSLVANTDINPIVITLGTMFLYKGLAVGIAGSSGAVGYNGITGFPDSFLQLSYGNLGIVPYTLIFILFLGFLFFMLLHMTRLGRQYYLVGVNKDVAVYSGISVKFTIISAYLLTSLCAGIAGIFLTSYFTSARSDLGSDALLPALTSVVLGGANINGGSGSIINTLIACFFIGYLKQGLISVGVSSDVSQIVVGILLILTISLKILSSKIRTIILNKKVLYKI